MIGAMGGEEPREVCVESSAVSVAWTSHRGLPIGMVVVGVLAFFVDSQGILGFMLCFAAVHGMWRSVATRRRPALVRVTPGPAGKLSIERSGGHFLGGFVVARSEITNAWLWRDRIHNEFVIATPRHLIKIRVPDRTASVALSTALGVDIAQQLVATTLTGPAEHQRTGFRRFAKDLPLLVAALSASATLLLAALAPNSLATGLAAMILLGSLCFAAFTAITRKFAPTHVLVGRDGIVLATLGRRKFIGYDRVQKVRLEPLAVALTLTNAEVVLLPMAPIEDERRSGDWTDGLPSDPDQVRARRHSLADQIETALRRFNVAGSHSDLAPRLLARGSRSLEEWRDALLQVRSYREPHFDADALVKIVENPQSPIEQRLGAALALGDLPDQDPSHREHKVRVRAAIRSSANKRVRIALERAADGTLDDAAYEAAVRAEAKLRERRTARVS